MDVKEAYRTAVDYIVKNSAYAKNKRNGILMIDHYQETETHFIFPWVPARYPEGTDGTNPPCIVRKSDGYTRFALPFEFPFTQWAGEIPSLDDDSDLRISAKNFE